MKKYFFVLFLLIVLIFKGFSQEKPMKETINTLINYKSSENDICFSCIRNNLDSAIYYLIETIDLNSKVFIGFQDKYSSLIAPNPNYIGINSMYFLELILLDSINTHDDITQIRIYNKCVLVKKKMSYQTLSIENMRYLKSVYLNWYKKTKKLSIKEKRRVWRLKVQTKILLKYKWI